jgi:hypothetical protein
LIVPNGSWTYSWIDVPFYPAAAILACQGKVNASTFDGIAGFPAFPPQSLMCMAPEVRMRRNAVGQPSFDIDWILDYRPAGGLGWNGFFRADTQQYEYATFGGGPVKADGSNLVFKTADFGQLFQVGETFAFG